MTRSGMEATSSAFLYSGFFLKREEFSRVEANSVCTCLDQLPSSLRGIFDHGFKKQAQLMLTFVRLLELWL